MGFLRGLETVALDELTKPRGRRLTSSESYLASQTVILPLVAIVLDVYLQLAEVLQCLVCMLHRSFASRGVQNLFALKGPDLRGVASLLLVADFPLLHRAFKKILDV